MNNVPSYQVLNNRPMGCSFCGANINGRITEKTDPKTKQIIKECRWICSRCGNVSRIGILPN
jgi:hypothetical protein